MAKKQTYNQDELIDLIRQRNQRAFTFLYDNYSKALFGVINSIVNSQEEAEDVLQNTFVKIWNNFSSYDESKGRLYTWMLNIARNLAIDSTRSKHEKIKSKIQSTSDTVYQKNNLYLNDNAHESIGIKTILNTLKEEHKIIIDLAYFEGYTQEEISKKLNLPLGTVKTKVRQAILTLRDLTKKEFLQ
ncbi:MAG: sigma-70 family RNA polymerase sigma factor [Bacteroidota bacterium]|nr:sigma-70 family RNA polymerase sigma factor [Bacteroidota bacterium]